MQAYNAVVRQTLDFRWRHLLHRAVHRQAEWRQQRGARRAVRTRCTTCSSTSDTEDSLIHMHYDDSDGDGDGGAAGGQPSAANRPLGLRTSASACSLVSLGAASRLWAVGALTGPRDPAAARRRRAAPAARRRAPRRTAARGVVPPATFRAAIVAARHFPRDATALRAAAAGAHLRLCAARRALPSWPGASAPPPPPFLPPAPRAASLPPPPLPPFPSAPPSPLRAERWPQPQMRYQG